MRHCIDAQFAGTALRKTFAVAQCAVGNMRLLPPCERSQSAARNGDALWRLRGSPLRTAKQCGAVEGIVTRSLSHRTPRLVPASNDRVVQWAASCGEP